MPWLRRELTSDEWAEWLRERALALRRHAASLAAESKTIRERSKLLADHSVQNLLGGNARPLGARGDTFSLRLARVPSAVGLARHSLRRWLESGGVEPEEAREIVLACSEACANAVEHPTRPGHQAFEVEARRTADEVEVAVRDFGRWRPSDGDGTRGRGLEVIRSLMDATEVVTGDRGTELVMRRAFRKRRR